MINGFARVRAAREKKDGEARPRPDQAGPPLGQGTEDEFSNRADRFLETCPLVAAMIETGYTLFRSAGFH